MSDLRTFVFADVRGYTSYTREHGDEAGAALAAQLVTIVEELAEEHEGTLQEVRGDEVLLVFESARRALRFAVALQERSSADGLARPLGIGLDAGEAVRVGDGFRGGALNRAARLCSAAGPGEILASDGVVHLAGHVDGVRYGLSRLERAKGFPQPVRAFEVHPADAQPGRQLLRRAKRLVRGTRPRLRLALASGVAAAAAVAVALALLLGSNATNLASAFQPNSIALLKAGSGSPIGTIARGLHTCLFARVRDQLWACDADQPILLKVSGQDRRVADQVPLPVFHAGFTVGFGSVWVGDATAPKVYPVDIRYRTAGDPIRLPGVPAVSRTGLPENATSLVTTKRFVWVAYGYPKRIARIDPKTRRVTFNHALPQECPCETFLAAGESSLWAVAGDGLHLFRLDAATGETLARGRLHEGHVTGVAVANGYLWVAVSNIGGVWKVDPSGIAVDKVPTGAGPASISAADGYLWVANADAGTVTRIDPASGKTRSYDVGHRPLQVVEIRGTLLVGLSQSAGEAAARVAGGKVIRALAANADLGVDPPFAGDSAGQALAYATGARLVEARTSRTGLTTIEPELAADLPAVSRGGRTYTFTIRRGLRFSPPSSEPVTAEAVRYTVERALSPELTDHSCRDQVLDDVAGEDAFEAGRASHISGLRVAGTRLTITLVRPSRTLPARLASPCLSVVPVGTPVIPLPLAHGMPSAGPYYVDSFVPGQQIVLRRNPNYNGSRPQRVDAIILREGLPGDRAGGLVERGQAAYAVDASLPPDPVFAPGGRYERQFGKPGRRLRYVRPPSSSIALLLFQTKRGLFRDASLRRAVNYALDRTSLAAAVGGTPQSALIPPGVPGASPRQPYPPSGDLRRARTLAPGRGGTATIAFSAGDPLAAQLAQAVGQRLSAIGIRLSGRPAADPVAAASDPRRRIDAVGIGWQPAYVDPFDVVNVLLDPSALAHGYPRFFDQRAWTARMQRAAATPQSRRGRVYRTLDTALAKGPAPFAVLFRLPGAAQLFSRKVGCQIFLPQFDGWVDFSALCLR